MEICLKWSSLHSRMESISSTSLLPVDVISMATNMFVTLFPVERCQQHSNYDKNRIFTHHITSINIFLHLYSMAITFGLQTFHFLSFPPFLCLLLFLTSFNLLHIFSIPQLPSSSLKMFYFLSQIPFCMYTLFTPFECYSRKWRTHQQFQCVNVYI